MRIIACGARVTALPREQRGRELILAFTVGTRCAPLVRKTRAGGRKKRPTLYTEHGVATGALRTGLRAHKRGDLSAAIAHYEEVLRADPTNINAGVNLGTAYAATGSAARARAAFGAIEPYCVSNARALRDIGIARISYDDYEGGALALEAALARDPSLNGARLTLCRARLDHGDTHAAHTLARDAVIQNPSDASSHLELHRTFLALGDLESALCSVERAHGLAEFDANVVAQLAATLGQLGRVDQMDELLSRAAMSVPPHATDAIRYVLAHDCAHVATKRDGLLFGLARAGAGLALEFGVRHGQSTRVLASRTEALHAFDSFDGLPEAWEAARERAFSTAGERPSLPANVILHVGLFADTLPRFLMEHADSFALVHIDSDLYSSANTILDTAADRIAAGTVIVFDEYVGHAAWREHEYLAWQHACARYGFEYDYLSLSWITGQAVVHVTSRR